MQVLGGDLLELQYRSSVHQVPPVVDKDSMVNFDFKFELKPVSTISMTSFPSDLGNLHIVLNPIKFSSVNKSIQRYFGRIQTKPLFFQVLDSLCTVLRPNRLPDQFLPQVGELLYNTVLGGYLQFELFRRFGIDWHDFYRIEKPPELFSKT